MNHNFDFQDSVKCVYPGTECFLFNESYCIMDIPREMTDRLIFNQNRVRKIYPNAICYYDNHLSGSGLDYCDHCDYCEYCIMEGPIEKIVYGYWPKQYSSWCVLESMAWEEAWKQIEIDMIRKLEE
jgi:hypothetical protein